MVPLWSPLQAGRKFASLNPLGAEGAEATFWLSASNIRGGGGGGEGSRGGEVGGGGQGGTPPPPPTVYSRSNTSLPPLAKKPLSKLLPGIKGMWPLEQV